MNKAHLALAAALLLGVAEAAWYYPRLPAWMAVHFDVAGRPDGWGAKGPFLLTAASVPAVLLLLYGALRVFLRRVPDSLVNLPDKAYWLAPERRAQTLERFGVQAAYLVGLAMLLMDAQLYLVLEAACGEPPVLSSGAVWGTIVLFIAASVGWLVLSMRGFRRAKG